MASYQKVYYCKSCKTNVTVDANSHCKKCGGSQLNMSWSMRFRVMCLDGEKQKRLTGYETKKDLDKAYLEYMANYSIGNELKHKDSFIYEDLLKEYLQHCNSDNEDSTLYDKSHIFELFITPYFKGKNMVKVTKADLSKWQTMLWNSTDPKTKKEYSVSYRKKIRCFFHSFLAYCEEIHDIPNLLGSVKVPKTKTVKKPIIFWEIEEFNNFIETVGDSFWHTVWTTFMFTGARISEVRALSDNDITEFTNIDKSMAGKKSSTYRKVTKDSAYDDIVKQNTKNFKTVYKQTPDVLLNEINKYKSYKKENNMPGTFLFGGGFPLSEMTIRRRLNFDIDNYNAQHNIKLRRITPHGFRHSYVSLMIHLGVSTKVIAELIGDTEEQVIKTYGHLYKNATNNAINLLNESLK